MLGLIVLGMMILTISGGVWWYYDDSDLETVREQARQQGRPLEWRDLGLTPTDDEHLRLWQRVVVLAEQVASFQGKLGIDGLVRYKVWDPIPEKMRAHHAAIDAVVVTELVTLLDRLGDQPLVLHDHADFTRKLPEIGINRAILRFLQERLILSDQNEAPLWVRRQLAMCRRFTVDSTIQHLVHTSLLDLTLASIAVRLDDLKRVDPTIAADIMATLQPQRQQLVRALDGEFLMLFDLFSHQEKYLDSQFHEEWFMSIMIRAGRQSALCAHLDSIQQLLQAGHGALAWSKAAEADFYAARQGFLSPSQMLQGRFMPAWYVIVSQSELTALRAQVIAAELQGVPWPSDMFDPAGAPLRPIKRDGRVIAAYSVHQDGIDNGGDAKRDRVIPLYADPSRP